MACIINSQPYLFSLTKGSTINQGAAVALSKQDIQMLNEQFQRVIDSFEQQIGAVKLDVIVIKKI